MTIHKKLRRGLQDIVTLSSRIDLASVPYRAYMRLSCLEMEKFRRGKEKESALNRIESINTRFQEIEMEKVTLLQLLGERINNITSNNKRIASNTADADSHSKPCRNKNGFKLKY
ncbi:MAG: hypothetical protein AB1489_10570 [Acidobacteriota bacterium]